MVKTFTKENSQVRQEPETTAIDMMRRYEADEFEADTTEEGPVALLAERRRQFLAGLKARQMEADASAGK